MSFTALHLYFDDVAIGQEWESLGRTVTQADLVNFAGLSGDFNRIGLNLRRGWCRRVALPSPFRIDSGLLRPARRHVKDRVQFKTHLLTCHVNLDTLVQIDYPKTRGFRNRGVYVERPENNGCAYP